MKISSKTNIGLVRASNQDSYATGELPGGVVYAVVCDGMGGVSGGNIASETAVRIISEQIAASYREGMTSNSIKTMLQSALTAANAGIYDLAHSVVGLKGMGTTAVVAVLSDQTLHIVHAGDSRAYVVHDKKLIQITKDHTVVQSMIDHGEITPEQALTHPNKNVITRALGVEDYVEIDYNEVLLDKEDAVFLCTDGLSNYVSEEQILHTLETTDFYEYPDRLIDLANRGGGGDNITVVVVAQ